MSESTNLSFDRLLELLAEKLATKLLQEPSLLYPRLLSVDLAAVYLGRSREAVQILASSGKIPIVLADQQVFLDRRDLDEWIEDNKVGWANTVGQSRGKRHGS
jgi:hypothetical protein